MRFIVPGIPVPKGRPRLTTINGSARAYTPKKTKDYESIVAAHAKKAMCGNPLILGGCYLEIELFFQIPSSWSKKKKEQAISGLIRPISKPDCSNVFKAIEDALNLVVWKDDSQVVEGKFSKFYSETPRAIVSIKEVLNG